MGVNRVKLWQDRAWNDLWMAQGWREGAALGDVPTLDTDSTMQMKYV